MVIPAALLVINATIASTREDLEGVESMGRGAGRRFDSLRAASVFWEVIDWMDKADDVFTVLGKQGEVRFGLQERLRRLIEEVVESA